MTPLVEVRALSKRFGPVRALDNVSVAFSRASFHAVIGENGAGKSTLVKCMMGYQLADAGEIVIDDEPHRIGTGKVGPITKRLQARYFDVVKGSDSHHPEWHTRV